MEAFNARTQSSKDAKKNGLKMNESEISKVVVESAIEVHREAGVRFASLDLCAFALLLK